MVFIYRKLIYPYVGREIWLEAALDGLQLTLTEQGCTGTALPFCEYAEGFHEEALHCHYQIQVSDRHAKFSLFRTREDLDALLEEAEALGVTAAVGLWQELG